MEKTRTTDPGLYRLDGKPSWGASIPQALQHVLAMLAGNITPPILIAVALKLPESDKVLLMQAAMLIGGLTTLLQLYPVLRFGMGLPNVMGVAFAYMPVLLAIGNAYGIEAIFGAQLVGAFVSIFIGKGYVKVSGMLIGIAAGYILALVFGNIISFDNVRTSSWVAFPTFFKWGLKFHPTAILSMILMYVVQSVQTIGDVSSTAIGGFNREATDQELGGAIKGQGICGMLGACIGGLPTDPYSQNVGLIVTSKVVAKRVFMIVGALMLAAGFIPKFGALMTTIPMPVLGGATVTVFAAITMSGIQLITQQPMNYRNKMIVGISLALGMGLVMVPNSLQFCPQQVRDIIGSSPIVLSFLLAFVLNIVVPQDDSVPEED